jgi:MYXO-CTERM domain-containing protein
MKCRILVELPGDEVDVTSWLIRALAVGVGLLAAGVSVEAQAQNCLSNNPADWPAASKPYFMLVLDTSGSMVTDVGIPTSCGYGSTRAAHARCAVRNTILAYDGQVNMGLSTFAVIQNGCDGATCACGPGGCFNNCSGYFCFQQEIDTTGVCGGCGPRPGGAATRAGAFIRVPMLQHNFWTTPPNASNTSSLLSWVDNTCTDAEAFAIGATPLNGVLRDMRRYFAGTWTAPDGSVSFSTPLATQDLAGAGVNGSTGCRSVNVILLTDGDETCDAQADAVAAATELYQTGVSVGGKTFKIRTHVINFAGGSAANTNAIAAAGGTATSYFATNETQLSQALSTIISDSVSPEVCNNADDNCNGCVDEGYVKYCNTAQTCCAWTTPAQRTTCLANFTASLNTNPPDGNLALLPCTTPAQQADSASWLCFNPGDECDDVDNNCSAGVDEGSTKCGNPLSCPTAEVCDGQDDDCDGLTDEGGVCGTCVPSPEICDGCDNDCDGVADDGIAPVACGLASPPNCAGTLSCNPAVAVPIGTCVPGGGFGTCSNSPQTEVCDGVDNDCDGIPDDNVAPTSCTPPNTPPGLVYGGTSQCQLGVQPCNGVCSGFVGPSAEICDGVDNDCDGQVDEQIPQAGQPCGINQPPCSPGLTACVNGALVCQGGTGAQPEQCDGIDNDCDGQLDEAPLADAPAPGNNGCWSLPGNCCSHDGLFWCPPAGGTCGGTGTLTAPCNAGTLQCGGALGWQCLGGTLPAAEVCDGVDNDCDGQPDDGSFPTEGNPCGLSAPAVMGCTPGDCVQGTIQCQAGLLDCVGDVPPVPELCNGKDDNCDGQCDNGIPVGGPCTPPYDTTAFPGDRTAPPCQPGNFVCDAMGGLVCMGGVGPVAEVCDGIDNDCDGTVDESGPGPDGIDGSQNPLPPPVAAIGDVCGSDEGACEDGSWGCVSGLFVCLGGVGPQPESCDCLDNDCDGETDDPNANDDPPLCGRGKDCVATADACLCAAPCGSGEFPCPTGQVCERVTSSNTGEVLGNYCIANNCVDCDEKTVISGDGAVECAPLGTPGENCFEPPVCVCKGQAGCRAPCFSVTCDAPLVCTNVGPRAGSCVVDSCLNLGCGCDELCTDAGSCVPNPCADSPCDADEVCNPADDGTFACYGSCAGIDCGPGTVCQGGECVPTCDPVCDAAEYCDLAEDPPVCKASACGSDACPQGGCCDPTDGSCGACPCEGVVCPDGQECVDDQCTDGSGGAGGSGGGGGTGGAGGSGGGAPQTGGGGSGAAPVEPGVWGLATGGGGCSCRTDASEKPRAAWSLSLLGLALAWRRRRAKGARRETAKG